MADTVQFDLVSPERRLVSVEAREVDARRRGRPDGDGAARPLITTLRPGIVHVTAPKGRTDYAVTGGFAEINARSMSVLAERAIPREEMTQEHFKSLAGRGKRDAGQGARVQATSPARSMMRPSCWRTWSRWATISACRRTEATRRRTLQERPAGWRAF